MTNTSGASLFSWHNTKLTKANKTNRLVWLNQNAALMLISLFLLSSSIACGQETRSETQSSLEQEQDRKSAELTRTEQNADVPEKRASLPFASLENFGPFDSYTYAYLPNPSDEETILNSLRPNKRGMDDDQSMPGVLRFGKRSQSFIRFGRSIGAEPMMLSKKEMPGVLRFGKRSQQEKKAVPGVLRFGKRGDMPGVLRFGKRESDIPGVLRFGKRSDMPGVLRFGKRTNGDMPGVLRFGKRAGDMPGVLRFG